MSMKYSEVANMHRVERYIASSDTLCFLNRLTLPDLHDTLEALMPAHRERVFTPTETLSMFMAQALKPDRSCQSIVNDVAVTRWREHQRPCSTNTGAYCKARQRLPKKMVSELVVETGRLIDAEVPEQKLWCGRRVRLVDGTTVTLPDTPANQAAYPQQSTQKSGLGFPICRIVVIVCLFSGAVLNAAMGRYQGKKTGETALFRSMLDSFQVGDVVLADSLYATYFMLAELIARGVDVVFEQHGARQRSTDFGVGEKLGHKDHLITLTKPKIRPEWMTEEHYASAPATLTVREVKVGGKVLVTTLICPKTTSKAALKALYKQRWSVELDIRNIKTTLGMETLSCKTPEMAEKEMFVYLLAYNLIRLIMTQSALLADVLPRSLSFKHAQQLWLTWSAKIGHLDDEASIEILFELAAEQTVGNRPGRIEPRAIKRRLKPYPLLMETRAEAKARILEFGHPKKIK